MALDIDPIVPAPTNGAQPSQVQDPVNTPAALDPGLVPFLAPSQEPSPQEGQPSAPASVTPPVPQNPLQNSPHYQSLYTQTYNENQQLKRELELVRQLQQVQTPQMQPAPDPATDPAGFVRFTMRQEINDALKQQQQMFQQAEQQRMTSFAETAWVQQHPGVDVQTIKNFNRMNGIADWNLEAGYRLLNQGNEVQAVARQTMQNTVQAMRSPATPQAVRSTQGAQPAPSGPVALKFDTMLKAYVANPGIYDSWDKPAQLLFDQELANRKLNQEG